MRSKQKRRLSIGDDASYPGASSEKYDEVSPFIEGMEGSVKLSRGNTMTGEKKSTASSKWSWGLGKKKKEVEAAPRERKNLHTLPANQPGEFERRDASQRSKDSGMAQNTSSSRSSTPRPRPPLIASSSSTTLATSVSLERKIHDGVESMLDGSVNTTERLAGLRAEMDKASVDF